MISHGLAATLLIALAAGPAARPPRADPAPPRASGDAPVLPVRVPGGVADGEGTVVLVRTVDGGLDAVDAGTGASLWREAAPARALLAARGVAYVLAGAPGALRVLGLDLRTGRRAASWSLPPATLPRWAALLEESGGRVHTTVAVAARIDGSGSVLALGLEARQVTYGGIGIIPGPEARAVARVDMTTGAVEVSQGARLTAPPLAVSPPPDAGRLVRFHAREADERLMRGGPPPDVEGVLVAGDWLVGFERVPGAVVVHRWSAATGARAAPVTIAAEADAIWPTLDRRHVALRRVRDQRRVDVYALDGGPAIATLEGAIDLAVLGGRLYWTRWSEGEVELLVQPPDLRESRSWRRTLVPREGALGPPIP